MCLFLYDPSDNAYAYKIHYFNGASAGHAVNVNPTGSIGYLGNAGQHLILYDANTVTEVDRISTLRFEANDTTIRGSTHVVWHSNDEFITAIGDYFYKFSTSDLSTGEKIGPHKVKLPHGMKRSASGRYICYGSMDNPRFRSRGEARELGVLDVITGEVTHIKMPTTCWHVAAHPTKDLFYAISFRVLPQDHVDYHEWAMAFLKEYAYEIDPAAGGVVRHWTCGREVPAHINSDITISDKELIFCNGGSQSIVCVDLDTFQDFRIIDEKPDLRASVRSARQIGTQVYDVLARGGVFNNTRHMLGALRVSRFSLIDSVYACQLSADQSLLFTANRGLNHITVYNYPDASIRLRAQMPDIQEYVGGLGRLADPRLGFHHSYLINNPHKEAAPA